MAGSHFSYEKGNSGPKFRFSAFLGPRSLAPAWETVDPVQSPAPSSQGQAWVRTSASTSVYSLFSPSSSSTKS